MVLDKFRIDGQVAVVTGATKGIGRVIAQALAEAGADIAVVSRNPDKGIQEAILSLGKRYSHHAADLTDRNQTRNVPPMILKEMGDINILVNNSGIIRRAPVAEYSEEDWDATLEIDLTAAFILSQACGQIMLKKGKGKIINISSVLAFQGGMNVVAYSSAKHGLVGLTKAFANDWAGKGVNVNAIAPSFFVTEMTSALRNDLRRSESISARTPAGRWGDPEDIAGAAVYLASAASDLVHGAILPADGGWLGW